MKKHLLAVLWWVASMLSCGVVDAHEILPASLLLQETVHGSFDVRWRVPAQQGAGPAAWPRFPADCDALSEPAETISPGARAMQWRIRCRDALRSGGSLSIDGLEATLLDTVVRVGYADGSSVSLIAHPRSPSVVLPSASDGMAAGAYFQLGVEHILTGFDHLLFVLCLILLIPGRIAILKTITAFTLAHSVTLAMSALGVVHVPQAPVEAAIALSIVFLARELTVLRQGGGRSLAAHYPWVVAFLFGLLHGFGFAGALAEIGLPHSDVPLSLLLFNFGVEAGQLVFVAAVYLVLAMMRRSPVAWPRRAALVPGYAIGVLAASWWLQRMAVVFGT